MTMIMRMIVMMIVMVMTVLARTMMTDIMLNEDSENGDFSEENMVMYDKTKTKSAARTILKKTRCNLIIQRNSMPSKKQLTNRSSL